MSYSYRSFSHDAERQLTEFSRRNPEVTPLHVAENVLLARELEGVMNAGSRVGLDDIGYQFSHGTDDLREQVAQFLNRSLRLTPALDGDQVSLSSGTRCALDLASTVLLSAYKHRDVLMPTPYWHGFDWIFEDRLGGEILPIPLKSSDGFALTLDKVRSAYDAADHKPVALVLTQPQNPLGVNYSRELLDSLAMWLLEDTEMQLFSDEIYAHCQIPGTTGPTFTSALALDAAKQAPNRIHVFWGFAKDFGLSGFRVGVLASRHKALHKAVRATPLNGFSPMTSSNNWLLEKLFATRNGRIVADELMQILPARLGGVFEPLRRALSAAAIPFFEEVHSAQFFWLDLRRWLGKTAEIDTAGLSDISLLEDALEGVGVDPREQELHRYLVARARVNLLPGGTLSSSEPGFFRLCFTAKEQSVVMAAVGRMITALGD